MNVAFLLKEYFDDMGSVSIDVFDSQTLNEVYKQVLETLTSHFSIEVGEPLKYLLKRRPWKSYGRI